MSNQQPAEKAATKKDGEDLTTILDQTQRADLTLLIASITESMRNLLLQNFDANAGLDKSFSREGMSEEDKLMSADLQNADVEAMDKQKKLKEEYEKDLSTLKMKNLKKNSLKAFDGWREQVLLRVGEIVNSKETAKQQLESTTSTDAKPEAPTTISKTVEAPDRGSNLKFKDLYPPTKNPLTKLSMDQRTLIIHSLLLLLLSLKYYNAPSRVLLLLLTSSLKLPLRTFEQDEYATAKGLLEGVKEMSAEEETKKKVEENKESRKWKVGLATVAGAALIGVTGGLAAPLVAAGVGSVMGGIGLGATSAATYLGSVAGSTYLVGGLFGAYGGRMTGTMMDNYAREVEDFEFLPVHSNKKTSEDEQIAAKQASDHDHKLRVTVCISGWLTEKEEILKPWRVLGTGAEVFALKYELEAMLNLGNAMNGFVQSAAWGYAQKQVIAQTIFADLAGAMWPIGLMKAARIVDNPFQIAKARSEKAGEVLADALINKAQGERPVTLIGYSLGARVIYTCLISLAKRKAFGLVENAVLVGAPTPSDTSDWRMLRSVVSGRLINVYSQNDYVLGFMYRTSSLQYGVAGLQAVQGLKGVENVDVSDEVSGHLRYRYLIGSILKKIGFEDVDMQAVEQEKQALAKMEEEEKKNSLLAQRKIMIRRESTGGKGDEGEEAEHEASEIEKEIQAKTQKSMITKAIEYFYVPGVPGSEAQAAAARDPKSATQDSSQAGAVSSSTQASGQTFGQRAYSVLPSMPNIGRSSPEQSTKDAAKAQRAGDDTQPAQSYTSRAAGYLPSMPKSLPSMPKSLPSMPSLPSRGKAQADDQSKPTQAAKDTADVGQQAAKGASKAAGELLGPTIKNTINSKDNPAVTAGMDATKKVPGLSQATNPGVDQKASDVTSTAQTTVQNTIQMASNTGKALTNKAEDANKGLTSQAGSSAQQGAPNQSYAKYAASYLPSIPKSIPGWSSATESTPKLERKDSSRVKSPPPKLERRGSSQVKSTPPKLERRGSSQVKSPPPKLERRGSSQVKSPPPRLDQRISSGITSPLSKLDPRRTSEM